MLKYQLYRSLSLSCVLYGPSSLTKSVYKFATFFFYVQFMVALFGLT